MGSAANSIAIESLFTTGWTAVNPTVTINYDNIPFAEVAPTDSYVKIEVWDGPTVLMSVGAASCIKPRRSVGTVFVTIYTPFKQGSNPARDYADQVTAIFRDVQVSGITFEEPDIQRLGEEYYAATGGVASGTAQWYQIKVAIPFSADEFI